MELIIAGIYYPYKLKVFQVWAGFEEGLPIFVASLPKYLKISVPNSPIENES
jgi:hypothetical protein